MNNRSHKKRESNAQSPSHSFSKNRSGHEFAFQLAGKRSEAMMQRKMQEMADNSPRVLQLRTFQENINRSSKMGKLNTCQAMFAGTGGRGVIQRMFSVGSMSFSDPKEHNFSLASALAATEPIARGEARRETGRAANTGVYVGDVGSYGYVQYLEQTGDGLTGDHQPSGAAVKEAIRELLHKSLNKPLTRSMAKNAYQKAITIVMTDVWHKLYSRTYGGRNTKAQIFADAMNLTDAAIKDWKTTVAGLKLEGYTDREIEGIWEDLCQARMDFFETGKAQVGTL